MRAILEGAASTGFEDTLPENIPDFDSLPELDRKLYKKKRNDAGNAQRLVARYGEDLLFIKEAGWYGWTGSLWSLDEGENRAYLCAEQTADDMFGEALAALAAGPHENEPPKKFKERISACYKFALGSGNATRMTAMVNHAARYLSENMDVLDTKPFLLNLSNGTLNLKAPDTGEENFDGVVLEKHNRAHKISKVARAAYDPEAQAPVFQKFISEVVPDDEIRLFLQRFFGYCLTGDTGEQIIVMFWGEGSNGKSTLMDLIDWLLGDYALVTPFASLLHTDQRRGSDASPDLARLPGCRFVSAAEPDTGARFSESMLKQLTGGEKMTVRHLHRDFFEFKPHFKLCLSFNNKPYIRGQDEGIWRRILLVPFTQRFVDPDLLGKNPGALPKIKNIDEKLRAEAPGILNWILDGYRMWAERGLDIPDKVRAATAEYRHESNPVHQFIHAWCEIVPGASIQASRLYEAYQLWCKENAMDPLNQTNFGRRMTEMKFDRETIQVVFYRGLQLGAEAEERIYAEERKRQRKKDGSDE